MVNKAGPFIVGAGAGVLGTLLLRAREARATAPEDTQQLWDMIIALMESEAELTASINNLVVTMGGTPTPATVDPFENTEKFVTGQVICTVINQGFQLPSIPIPKNKQLVVKALPVNVGTFVLVGVTQGDSQNLNIAYPLVPNEAIGLLIENADKVWVSTPALPLGALNDGIAFIVEQT